MMGRKAARNLYNSNTNKFGIQCVCWFHSQGMTKLTVASRYVAKGAKNGSTDQSPYQDGVTEVRSCVSTIRLIKSSPVD